MDAAGLRALQAPIKEHYKADPKAGFITLKAKGTLDDGNIAVSYTHLARRRARCRRR